MSMKIVLPDVNGSSSVSDRDDSSPKPKIVVICGATGLGKTASSIQAAQALGAEIIGADSMQVYRHMDIGTAKPTPSERAKVPHHMIDVVDPDEPFDAARYCQEARTIAQRLHTAGILPLVVGGTGLYIKALLYGLFEEGPSDLAVRSRLKSELELTGSGLLHDRLARLDPEAAARIHPNDSYRILRALEVREATGKSISAYHGSHRFGDEPFQVLKIGLSTDRQVLYDRIDRRVDAMIEAGLLDEVRGLLERGYGAHLKPMQSIGYRHMADFLEGRRSWEESVRTMKRDTRRYAKRQMTWFRADPGIAWMEPERTDEIASAIRDFLGKQ